MKIGRIPLQEQVDYFEQTKAHIVEKMGETAANILLKNAIFSIAIGSNDILNYIQPSIPFIGQEKVEPSMFQDFMLSNLTMQLKVHIKTPPLLNLKNGIYLIICMSS